jgi:hypothetical protein
MLVMGPVGKLANVFRNITRVLDRVKTRAITPLASRRSTNPAASELLLWNRMPK